MRNAGDRVAGGSSGRRQRPPSPEPPPPAGTGGGASLFTPAYRVSHGPAGARGSGAGQAGLPAQPGLAGQSRPASQDYPWAEHVPGYASDYDAGRDASWLGDDLSAGFGWGDGDPAAGAWPGGIAGGRGQGRRAASNAVRGFPPAPGDSLPVYPPGPFDAWNRGPDRAVAPRTGEPARPADGDATQLTSATITPDEFDTDYSLPAIKDPIPGAAAASAGGATLTGSGQAAGSSVATGRAGQNAMPGEPVRRGSAAGRPGTGPGHRAAGRSRADIGRRVAPAGSGGPVGQDAVASQPAAAEPGTKTGRQAGQPRQAGKRGGAAGRAPRGRAGRGRAGQDRAGQDRAARARTGRKRHSHWPAIGAAGAIIVAVAAVLVYTLPKHTAAGTPAKPRPASTPSPAATGPATPPGPWRFIGARKTDAMPLTMAEVFPATISDGTTSYTRARQVIGQDCHASVIGSALQAAVRKAGCSQALRATYLSKAAKVMATIGVFNLKNAAEAGKAAAKAGHSQFVTQLTAKAGPAKAIGQGTGLEEALVKGHYLVLVWAEPTNVGASPAGKGKGKLDAFMNLLVAHTVNVSLSYRMVNGKPPPAG